MVKTVRIGFGQINDLEESLKIYKPSQKIVILLGASMTICLRSIFNESPKLPTLNITMLDPSGVGKTSLLAAMYDQFDNVSKDLELMPDEEIKLF